jgi:hypothetical protein
MRETLGAFEINGGFNCLLNIIQPDTAAGVARASG